MSQTNEEILALLEQYNTSIGPRQLVLYKEVGANKALLPKARINIGLISAQINSQFGGEWTLQHIQKIVSALHKSSSGLCWMEGRAPGCAREEKPQDSVANSQGDLIQRQTEDRQKKIDATTLANAQGRCANLVGTHHSQTQEFRRACLAEFARVSALPGATPETISKAVDVFIGNLTKAKSVGPRVHGV